MRIQDRPEFKSKRKPLVAAPSDTVFEIVSQMSERNYGSVVVVDDESHVVGIFTERDLLHRVVAQDRSAKETLVGDVMTDDVKMATASDDVVVWLRQMSNERFRHVPVVDGDGRLEQVMSQGDFVSYTWPELLTRIRRRVETVYPRIISPLWQVVGVGAYTLATIVVVRHAL